MVSTVYLGTLHVYTEQEQTILRILYVTVKGEADQQAARLVYKFLNLEDFTQHRYWPFADLFVWYASRVACLLISLTHGDRPLQYMYIQEH